MTGGVGVAGDVASPEDVFSTKTGSCEIRFGKNIIRSKGSGKSWSSGILHISLRTMQHIACLVAGVQLIMCEYFGRKSGGSMQFRICRLCRDFFPMQTVMCS